MKQSVIYLDMDGVICDFVGGLIRAHNRDDLLERYKKKEYPITWNMEGELGSEEELWVPCDYMGSNFWRELEPYPSYERVIEILDESGIDWYICSHARNDHESYAGKIEWIHDYLGIDFENIILTKHKHLLAHDKALLIDDNITNCVNFINNGGRVYKWKQPWNTTTTREKMKEATKGNIQGLINIIETIYGKDTFQCKIAV